MLSSRIQDSSRPSFGVGYTLPGPSRSPQSVPRPPKSTSPSSSRPYSPGKMPPRLNRYFLPGDGIRREVITADICRYLGNDALVKPGQFEGRDGFWVTAYRALTSDMIADLKADSLRWAAEVQSDHRVPYHNSRTHEHRQQYGPTQAQSQAPLIHTSNAQAPIGQTPTSQAGSFDTRPSAPGYYHEGYSVHPGQGQTPLHGGYAAAGGYGQPEYQSSNQGYDHSYLGHSHFAPAPQAATQPRTVSYSPYSSTTAGEGPYQSGHDSHAYQPPPPSGVPRGPQSSQQHPRGEPYGRGSYGK